MRAAVVTGMLSTVVMSHDVEGLGLVHDHAIVTSAPPSWAGDLDEVGSSTGKVPELSRRPMRRRCPQSARPTCSEQISAPRRWRTADLVDDRVIGARGARRSSLYLSSLSVIPSSRSWSNCTSACCCEPNRAISASSSMCQETTDVARLTRRAAGSRFGVGKRRQRWVYRRQNAGQRPVRRVRRRGRGGGRSGGACA